MPRVSQQRASFCECGNHAFLAMKRGVALVDTADAPLFEGNGWSVNTEGYAYSRRHGKLHRAVTGASHRDEHVDHISHDKLDNRSANLRLCDVQTNQFNKKPNVGCKSPFKGVSWYGRQGWVARITRDRCRRFIGAFPDEVSAALAYDRAAKEEFGEFAYLNFPEGDVSSPPQ